MVLAGQTYLVPPNLANEIDCYPHMLNWVIHQQGLIGQTLVEADFVFPAITSTGQIKFGKPTSWSGFEALVKSWNGLPTPHSEEGFMEVRR
jgi:hypothetical protein